MISPLIAIFAALVTLFSAGLFSFLLPKVADHYKEMNYRLLKELIDIRDSEGTTDDEKVRFNKIISERRASYLKKQETAFDEFFNDRRIETLKNSDATHENLSELVARKKTEKHHGRRFHKTTWGFLGLILLAGIFSVTVAWLVANWIISIF
jgi:hypothetical protein